MSRPNTAVNNAVLHENLLLCCGEDTTELLRALPDVGPPVLYHEYRCYRFWRFEGFTLVWTGIGTGCLEPLLFELFANDGKLQPNESTKEIGRIILVGTAGAFRVSEMKLGQVYILDKAFLGGSAISVPDYELTSAQTKPLKPRLTTPYPKPLANVPASSIVSTDYYYGFSRGNNSSVLRQMDRRLNAVVDYAWQRVSMVDMETAQFYYFCQLLGSPVLQYAALKGPANYIEGSEQGLHSLTVLRSAVRVALRLLLE